MTATVARKAIGFDPGVSDWLALMASPTFATMAWVAYRDMSPFPFCSSGPHILPVDGMTLMYLLMGVFHLSPWTRLAAGSFRTPGQAANGAKEHPTAPPPRMTAGPKHGVGMGLGAVKDV